MAYTVIVEPSGRSFEVEAGETLLDAGIRQGVDLPYGCKDGACGACKCKKLAGAVTHGKHLASALPPEEEAAGYVLTCCSTTEGNVMLQSSQVTLAGAMPVRKMPARVAALERLSPNVMRVRLQLPAKEKFRFRAGQFIECTLPSGIRRSYSMANAPHTLHDSGLPLVELHIRHMPGGLFSGHVFGAMQAKEILRIEGPFGSFYLREDTQAPIVLLASGTGFAPVKAIIEHMQASGCTRAATLYWGGRRPQDLYLNGWVQERLAELPQLRYVPVLSDAQPGDAWTGRTGLVHQAVLQDLPDLSAHQVYACGAPAMVEAARRDFAAAGLPPEAFYADAFVTTASKAAA